VLTIEVTFVLFVAIDSLPVTVTRDD